MFPSRIIKRWSTNGRSFISTLLHVCACGKKFALWIILRERKGKILTYYRDDANLARPASITRVTFIPLVPFHRRPPSFRALFLTERIHFARFPFSRTDYACVQIAAARRMAAKGYRCTSNYDQCVPFDLTTLFSPSRRAAE